MTAQKTMLPGLLVALATPLDDYVAAKDPNYGWFDTNNTVTFDLLRAKAHILNVTSQQWLTTDKAIGPNGALWTHQVAVAIPDKPRGSGTAVALLTGGCNEGPPKPPDQHDEYLLIAATVADMTGLIAIVVYQIPNCHIVYPSDPERKGRSEDAMIAWAWREYVKDPAHDPKWLPRLPMVKAGMACMLAAEEFVATLGSVETAATAVAPISSWTVSGASKRGWTSWMVGAVAAGGMCAWCPKVSALAPLVPIVPYLNHSVHLQRQSLGGFTFAFSDYLDAGVLQLFDTPEFQTGLALIEPAPNYIERLAKLPKMAVVSSDDEFMQLDWTQHGWATLPGETHLLVAPNSEHSLSSAIPELIPSLAAFIASVDAKEPPSARPQFSYAVDASSGALTVTLPAGSPTPLKVVLRHAQTTSDKRRDFRWVRLANVSNGDHCTLPDFPLKKPLFGGNCVQPIAWEETELTPNASASVGSVEGGGAAAPVVYTATPTPPKKGHWRGYYIELKYASTQLKKAELRVSTPGFVWPNTLPFPDCDMSECPPVLL